MEFFGWCALCTRKRMCMWLDGGAAGAVEAPGVLLCRTQHKAVGQFQIPPPLLLRPINQGLAIDQIYAPTFILIILRTE